MNEQSNERMFLGLPFTNEEIFQANALVYPRDALEAFWRENELPPQELTRMTVGESVVLLLAAMSAEYADRIVQRHPDMKPQVDRIREDPEQFIESERKRISEDFEREGQGP